jgi:hypothetical protein
MIGSHKISLFLTIRALQVVRQSAYIGSTNLFLCYVLFSFCYVVLPSWAVANAMMALTRQP